MKAKKTNREEMHNVGGTVGLLDSVSGDLWGFANSPPWPVERSMLA
jgi:hypothetical protein